jgi:4-amino-4-deoxy-L-arabinose transferase-like glycosyltransferase
MRRYWATALLSVASVGFVALGLAQAWSDAPTFDEPVYVASGLAGILHHDVTLNEEHPPLPKLLAALPVLFVHPVVPPDGGWNRNNERAYSARFVAAQERVGTLRSVTMASRLVPLLEAVALAFVLLALGRDLFGRAAGVLAGLLWLLSPFVLGLGHLDSIDVAFALTVGGWSWALLHWTRRPGPGAAAVVGLASAAAVLTDVTGLILLGIAGVAVAVIGWRRSPRDGLRQAATAVVVAWATVWIVYAVVDVHVLTDPTVLLPSPYLHGLSYLAHNDTIPGPGYLLGRAWTGGRWWYWPGSLLVKTVPTTLLFLVLGPLGVLEADRSTRWRVGLVLALPSLCLLGFNLFTPRDIGLRYLLPVIALWLVMASSIVNVARQHLTGSVVLAGVVATAAVATVLSAPNSLTWVTPPFGPAYRVVTNSDVDWGQGLYRLQGWSRRTHPWVAYFGPRGLGVGDVPDARPLLGTVPARIRGWAAVSATDLTSANAGSLAWLRGYCSVGELGNSIVLYRFDRPPSDVPGPTEPEGRCPGGDGGFSLRTSAPPGGALHR